jgi:hypothetical protein
MKLTKAQRRALEWFAARPSAHMFGAGDPSLLMVERLRQAGLVEAVGREAGHVFGFTKFAITPAGRSALQEGEG